MSELEWGQSITWGGGRMGLVAVGEEGQKRMDLSAVGVVLKMKWIWWVKVGVNMS